MKFSSWIVDLVNLLVLSAGEVSQNRKQTCNILLKWFIYWKDYKFKKALIFPMIKDGFNDDKEEKCWVEPVCLKIFNWSFEW